MASGVTLLLDTHIWLWMLTQPERLGRLREVIVDPATTLLLSAASTWELAIKVGLGRIDLPRPLDRFVADRIRSTRVTPLPVSHTHAAAVAELPDHHRDPFDRLLVAQARVEQVPVASADAALAAYEVDTIWP